MSDENIGTERPARPFVARTIHRFSILIILGWLGFAVFVTIGVPPLEVVEQQHSVSLTPIDAPSFKAMLRLGQDFKESNSGALAMIVLEADRPLGQQDHQYYDELVRRLEADTKHVQHVQNFWGDPVTAAAAQSIDGKAAYVQLNINGGQGAAAGDESVQVIRNVVAELAAPNGLHVYVTGPAATVADMNKAGQETVTTVTLASLSVIFIMLLLVYRSLFTVILLLVMVGLQLTVSRGMVALLGYHGLLGLTTFAVNLLVAAVIATGTDYGIFFVGRYQEARQAGEDRETAFYTTFSSVAKVVLASGLTIAGAVLCLSFTRLPYFQPLGLPNAVGIAVAVLVALTLAPALLAVGGRFGLFEPKRKLQVRGWRRIGTAIVRWPTPILISTVAVALIGLLTLPGYNPSYDDQKFIPENIPASVGNAAAARHFPESRMMMPEILLVEADHDLRNSTDMLVLNQLAKGILAVPGISTVQSVTRPEGTALAHTSIPYIMSMSQSSQLTNMAFQKDRMNDMLKQAAEMGKMIALMQHMLGVMKELTATTHDMVARTHEIQKVTAELRDRASDFEDFYRPLRSYFYWEKHCYDIPVCYAIRSVFDAIDGVDEVNDKFTELVVDLDKLDLLLPQIIIQIPQMIETMQSMRTMMLTMHSTMQGTMGQMEVNGGQNPNAMGQAYDSSKNDDSFYLPPGIIESSDAFKRVMKIFLSPDGKNARMLISQKGDPATPEGLSRVDPIRTAAEESLKGTPLEDSKIYLTGTAAVVKDLVDGAKYDLLIAGVAALCLIFIIMLIMTRSFFAALVIVGTVLLSLGASFGMSILVWQYLLGLQIHWTVLSMSVIVLLAVGSDYNLLLVSRMKEELAAGIHTGIIRAMAGTGKVVTNAGLVFAFTMASMAVSDLRSIAQLGTTIGMGLLFDTLVVRAFMTPAVAALLGRWFWWPQQVRTRPASQMLRPLGSRPLVRSLLLKETR
ncbi:membrane protein [Mycobacterium montefiorense]|uniref:Membrane protein n=1 Tax=Mycobacterium montefiorense TaxID=154654 RepID=A0AA37UMP5_9MYCO|nr:RND family transporter [Mycobacterium montefiorense]GBG38503.1 membrane protein [Mycobacterium montefiorense]GKU34331.1 membrane protein [Mycobacterium montefiorense]GKU38952.1 membrane protein [Mycobacterium montefiorense]GKU48013.1 membrane protein [Mycobacterium montefiorense]GKU49716.1 membrane protein [Mycobacterium montefiorense]